MFQLMAGWRMYGFSYTLAYAMPVVQSSVAAYCVYLGINRSYKYFIPMPLILFSAIINARIGIVIFAFAVTIVLIDSFKPNIKMLLAIAAFVMIIVFTIGLFERSITNETTIKWLTAGISDIFGFLGRTSYASDSYMKYATSSSNYKLPDSILNVLFGTGNLTIRDNYRYQSDVGYINDIWLGGILYCTLVVLTYFKKTIGIVQYFCKDKRSRFLFSIGAAGILLLSNIKGRCFAWNEIMVLWMIIYNCFLVSRMNEKYSLMEFRYD